MKTTIVILVSVTAVIIFILFVLRRKKESGPSRQTPSPDPAINGQMVVDTLESLGYFQFTDAHHLDALKKEIRETYDQHRVLSTLNAEKPPFEPYCRRYYFCDGETLFEEGGVVDYLKDIKTTFDKLFPGQTTILATMRQNTPL